MKNIDDFFEDARKQEAIISEEETLSLLSEASGTNFSNKKVKGNIMSVLISAASVAVASFILFNISSEKIEKTNVDKQLNNTTYLENQEEPKSEAEQLISSNQIISNSETEQSNEKSENNLDIINTSDDNKENNTYNSIDNNTGSKKKYKVETIDKSKLTKVKLQAIRVKNQSKILLNKSEKIAGKAILVKDKSKKIIYDSKKLSSEAKKMKVEGIKLLELSAQQLIDLELKKDESSYKFIAFNNSEMPILVTLKKDNYLTEVKKKLKSDNNTNSIHPVFVTDKKGNKIISLFQSQDKGTSIMLSNSKIPIAMLSNVNAKNQKLEDDIHINVNIDKDELETIANNNAKTFTFSSSSSTDILYKNKEDLLAKMKDNGLTDEEITRAFLYYNDNNKTPISVQKFDENGNSKVIVFRSSDSAVTRHHAFVSTLNKNSSEEEKNEGLTLRKAQVKLSEIINSEQFKSTINEIEKTESKILIDTISDDKNIKTYKIDIDSENEGEFKVKVNPLNNKKYARYDFNSTSKISNSKDEPEELRTQSKIIFQRIDSNFNLGDDIIFENQFIELEMYEKINQLLPVAIRLDDKNKNSEIDYILWYEPTEEFVRNLPLKLQDELAPEIAALRNGEKAICGEAPMENAHTDSWRACNGAIENLSVYPNPAVENANISFDLKEGRNISIALNDLSGKEIKKVFLNKNFGKGSNKFGLNLSGIPAGMYYISLTSGQGEQAVQRIIVE